MSNIREFLRTQKLKLTTRPYTLYPKSDIPYITEFQNGFASALVVHYYRYGAKSIEVSLIDTSFNPVISTQYICPSDSVWINGHLIAVNQNYPEAEKFIFLDKELKEVPDKKFSSIQSHGDCLIVSKVLHNPKYNRGTKHYGILDKNLDEILPLKYYEIFTLNLTRFYCRIEGETPIVFDCTTGKIYTLEGVHTIYKESPNGYCKFTGKEKLLGYLNHEFQIIINPKYKTLGDFDKNGFAPFARDNVVGVVDMNGKEFIR